MQSTLHRPAAALAASALSLVLGIAWIADAGARTQAFESEWFDEAIEIDGKLGDWAGSLTYIPEHDFTIGVRNDGAFLYVALIMDNPMLGARAVMNGLILVFDAEGEASRPVGVKFPLSVRELYPNGPPPAAPPPPRPSDATDEGSDEAPDGEAPQGPPPSAIASEDSPREGGPPPGGGRRVGMFRDSESLRAHIDRASYELDLLDAEGNPRRLGTDQAAETEGVSAAIAEKYRTLYYELKFPLRQGINRSTAIGARDGKAIALSIISPAVEAPPEAERLPDRTWGSERRGLDGNSPRGGDDWRRGGPPGGMRMNETFEFKARITVASPPRK